MKTEPAPDSFTANESLSVLPEAVKKLIRDFVLQIVNLQPGWIKGIYLTGSIPLKDYQPHKSDIDFIVNCSMLPDEKLASEIKKIHAGFAGRMLKPDLSGTYVVLDDLPSMDPRQMNVLSWHENSLRYGMFEMAPVSLFELKSHAFTIYGTPASQLSIPVNSETMHMFLYENINTYWRKWLDVHSSYLKRRLILLTFPRFTEWSVLGVARQICTLQTDRIVSKTEAGHYCLEHLPAEYHTVVREALSIREDPRTYPLVRSYAIRPSIGRVRRTLQCVDYLVSMFNTFYAEKYGGID
jgi:hypothetical protein